ncbi:hypothetical protein CROQUDRAFT_101938 [Cronartium quercuum f. sp. fusiforme G11]|uniref:Uncharacterized protein n=1 Tax=Cronartium quercuum f. sp. fusiforme G11 TaxID=708437 RepID=A0A9P6N520_9BASI|nr:hypothetical protein CROQUDRAFT_101938 [Cronartium quercuum f. sp. fusiforme G11]
MDSIQRQLNMVTEQLASFVGQKTKTTAPQKSNQLECLSVKTHSINPAPSYALAALKHAQPATPPAPKKHMAKKAQKAESESSLEIKQLILGGNALASLKQKDLITLINNTLKAKEIKLQEIGFETIQIRAVYRHPSNDLILYTDSVEQANTLKEKAGIWLPLVSQVLVYKPQSHHIVVHGILTTFNPNSSEDLEDLMAMNAKALTSKPTWIHWIDQENLDGKRYSSLILAMPNSDSAQNAVNRQIFWRRKLKRTEH